MTSIYLETFIDAPARVCFNLSRSIDLHKISSTETRERAIAGRTRGLIEKGEFVTWEAVHFGVRQNLTVKIRDMKANEYFLDEMQQGAFKRMWHEHRFREKDGKTVMTDIFTFEAPLGFLGVLAEKLILKSYLTRFLRKRNEVIKTTAETGEWKRVLEQR
jgi:ligand-binding SRPBCC domain-containing protein